MTTCPPIRAERTERILVLGCPGSGKSTFARRLARATGLRLIHLDAEFWRPGWVEPDRAEFDAHLDRLLAEPSWIMDGNYGRTLPRRAQRATLALVFEQPLALCLWRILKRAVTGLGKTRPDMAPGCPERIDWEFVRYTWRFPRDQAPKAREALESAQVPHVIFRSDSDAEAWLAGLSANGS